MNLCSGLLNQCRAAPGRSALIQDQHRLSYAQVQQQAQKIAAFLLQQPRRPQRIAVALERGIEATLAIYGISFAGACYVPLDIGNPDNRLRFITEDADVQYIIGSGHCPAWVRDPTQWLDINRLSQQNQPDTTVSPVPPEAIAAILYTSGSTGHPKGVALSHRAMLNFSQWAAKTFDIDNTDRIASLAPFHFDLSVFDLFTTLGRGAELHFMPPRLTLAPSRLTAWLQQNKITTWYTVPSLLSFIALKGALHATPLPDLRRILFAGEVFPVAQLNQLCRLLPEIDFYNLYGPTETNVCCYWPVDKSRLADGRPIPIGLPACGARLKVDAKSGELSVKSANNFSGYWHRGTLNTERVARGWYATGDKVSINERGEYCYHGRLDRMIKCAGYRVEPAEIEAVLNDLAGVIACAVIGVRDPASGQRPAAAVVLRENCRVTDIAKSIRNQLPAYMQPCRLLALPELPRLANGKTDYRTVAGLMEKPQPSAERQE